MTTTAKAFSVLDRIKTYQSQMPATMGKIAAVLIDDPKAPLNLSITELAERAGTSAASVTRFCRMIGYAGYVEMRVGIATDVGRSTARESWATEIGREFGPDDTPELLLARLIGSHTRSLREATSAIDLEVITDVSRRIARSHQVDVYGVGGSAMLAEELQGRLYRLSTDRKTWLLAQTGEGEITRLLPSGEGLLAATGDMGKLFRIGQAPAATGSYEAPVHDTATVARWGRLMWRMGDGGGTVRFETRSGNSARPDNTWSEWSEARNGAIASPNARFLQWHVELQGHASLEGVTVAYLPQNTPPAVRSILVSSAGPAASTASKAAASASSSASYSITVTDTGETPSLSSGTPSQTVGRTGGGQIQVSWQADDPDGDKLVYALYFRGEGEQTWKLLKDNLGENVYNIDGDALADGRYFFRVVASDRPSNPPGLARATDLESSPVLIDNTPPMVKITAARREGNQAEIDIEAADAASPLKRCEYSVDAGPWTLVEAADGITDSPREQFLIRAGGLTEGEHLVVIRVYDSVGNAGLVKTVLK